MPVSTSSVFQEPSAQDPRARPSLRNASASAGATRHVTSAACITTSQPVDLISSAAPISRTAPSANHPSTSIGNSKALHKPGDAREYPLVNRFRAGGSGGSPAAARTVPARRLLWNGRCTHRNNAPPKKAKLCLLRQAVQPLGGDVPAHLQQVDRRWPKRHRNGQTEGLAGARFPQFFPEIPEKPPSSWFPTGLLACPEGLEPPTCCLEGSCSIQLSYGQSAPRCPRRAAGRPEVRWSG